MACKATWQSRASPHSAQVAQMRGRATGVQANARVAPRGMRSDWAGMSRAHELVGSGLLFGGGNADALRRPTSYT